LNVYTTAQLLAMLIHELDVAGMLHLPKMALFTNDVVPSPNKVVADFTITDFGGLTNLKSVVYGTPFVNDSLQAEVRGANLSWATVTLPDPAVTAYGWVEVDTTGADVIRAERFAVPFQFNRAGQVFTMTPRIVWGN
jgi:hypothetical protein